MMVFDNLGMQPVDEINLVKHGIILDEDEEIVFDMCIRHKSIQEISFKICKSPRTVARISSRLRQKINNYYQYRDMA